MELANKSNHEKPPNESSTEPAALVINVNAIKHETLTNRILRAQSISVPNKKSGGKPEVEDEEGSEEYEIQYDTGEAQLERGSWGGKIDFILTCVSFAVGLGNVWRFPYLVYKNGGGAFLIPYVLMLTFVGIPIFFLEFAFGQFSSLGPISCWVISPLFKGVGVGMVIISWYLTIYYNVIISHCIFYLGVSFTNFLPWQTCGNWWNNNATCFDKNTTLDLSQTGLKIETPAEQYYDNYVLNVSDGIENFGYPSWKLVLCLMVAWIIVAAVLFKGVQSLGKISYFTAFFPYVMLLILLIRSLFLKGSVNGMIYYLTPRWERLKDPQVWTDAATQIFFSLSCCNGGLINMASYNKFKNNCCRDAVIVAIINCATSVFAGFVIFTNLGFMAAVKNTTIEKVAKGGPGLAFVVYPEALSNMPIAPMWAVFFFIMMVTLGFGSQFSMVECVISATLDELRNMKIIRSLRDVKIYRLAICVSGFLLGIPMLCPGGIYLLTLLDWTVSGYPLLVLGLLEILVVCYFYGINQFKYDISLMTKSKPNIYWKVTWLFVTPAVMVFLLIFYFSAGEGLKYGNYTYPYSWRVLGQFIALFPVIVIPANFMYRYCKDGGYILLLEYMKPKPTWGPHDQQDRKEFIDLIKSTESLRNKKNWLRVFNSGDPEGGSLECTIECPANENGNNKDEGEKKVQHDHKGKGDNDGDDDDNFFQSKHSIIEKLARQAHKNGNPKDNCGKLVKSSGELGGKI